MFVFYDTSCFSEMPVDQLRIALNASKERFITTSVFEEILSGYKQYPKQGFKVNGLQEEV